MRVELRDGQWADLRERITHGQDKELKRAHRRGREDPDQQPEFMTVLVRTFVRSWHVLDPDGQAIPLDEPDAIDRAPDDIVDALFGPAWTAWTGATIPEAPTPPSSDA